MAPSKLSGRHNNLSSDAPHRVDPDMLTGQIARGLDPGNVLPLSLVNCALLHVLHQATWVQLRNLLPCRAIVANEETINPGLALTAHIVVQIGALKFNIYTMYRTSMPCKE
jgi:hypothetical protein